MRKNNKDLVPIMASSGEQIASNPALELMGRDVVPYFNNLAIKAKEQNMTPHNYANGTMKRGGIQLPEIKKPKGKTGLGAYADGTVTASGLQLPRLGSALDSGNSINTPPGQIPGVVRNGNSYSQAPGFVPTQTLSAPPPTDARTGYSYPIKGYADGTTDEYGLRPLQQPGLLDTVRGMFSQDQDPQQQQQTTLQQPLGRSLEQSRLNYELQPRQEVRGYARGTLDEDGVRPEDINKLGIGGNLLSAQMIKAPYNGTASVIDRTIPDTSPVTNSGGLRSLAGDGYSVSSQSPRLGLNSTPESMSALDKTIAYNKTQGAKDQFAANAALSQGRYDTARQPQAIQQPQQSFQDTNQQDYQDQIQARLAELDRPASSIGGFDRMIADKKNRQGAQAGLAALLNLQKGAQDTGVDYAQLAQRGNEFGQELGFKQQQEARAQEQQQFANKLGLGDLAAKSSLAEIERQDKDRRFNLDQAKADSDKARLEQTKYSEVTDPLTGLKRIAPLSGPQADMAYEVQAGFEQRETHPEYKSVVEKFGQEKADQMYLDKLRQDAVRKAREREGKK